MRTKVTNDAIASIRALADKHGRDAEFAERAVATDH
jgi:membrane-bound ClpP family serine protease